MTKWRCPDSPAMYLHLGGNGLTATARIGWPSDPGILFASAHALAISAPAEQERREVYQTRLDRGGGATLTANAPVARSMPP